MNKKFLKLLGGVAMVLPLLFGTGCRKLIPVPNYVKPIELANLNTGMSKEQVKTTLGGLPPHEIFASDDEGCELVMYKYKTPAKKTSPLMMKRREGLTEGDEFFVNESSAYLYFKNEKLQTVVTDKGQSDAIPAIGDMKDFIAECDKKEGGRGCTDPEALNFDEYAFIENGSCTYCPCGSIKNENFNEKRPESSCNQKCILLEQPVSEEEKEEGCTNCDLIKGLLEGKSNVNLNIQMSLPAESSKPAKTINLPMNTKSAAGNKKAKNETAKKSRLAKLKEEVVGHKPIID